MTILELNRIDHGEFVRVIGPVFEHSPWIAEAAFEQRPFSTVETLHQAMCDVVKKSDEEKHMALIRAHPDLVGRAALAGTLTSQSTSEQAAAGLDKLLPEEIRLFQEYNAAYKEKFGFPFIICARLNKKQAILEGIARRKKNSREQEIKTALEEIFKIAELRLRDLIND
jgi:2-oxo-4-hydroxy-4-carboxy-5-ureidoimidazoline decarboxylase